MKGRLKTVVCALLVCTCLTACQDSASLKKQTSEKKEYVAEENIVNVLIEPDTYKDQWVKLQGKITQGPDVDGKTGYMVQYVSEKNRYFFVQTKEDLGYQVGDYIKVTGQVDEEATMKNALGEDISLASICNAKVKDGSYIDIEVPTYRTNKPNEKSQTIDKVKVTVSKVEYANEETRVYVTVDNKSSQDLIYDANYIIIQQDDSVVYSDVLSSSYENGNYPTLDGTIAANSKSSGIVVFPVISSERDCDVVLSLYTTSYSSLDFTIHVNA